MQARTMTYPQEGMLLVKISDKDTAGQTRCVHNFFQSYKKILRNNFFCNNYFVFS